MSAATAKPEIVVIVGAGTVGFAKGRALLERGHQVIFTDLSPARCDELTSRAFACKKNVTLKSESSLVFVCVPTPASSSGYDFSILRESLEELGRQLSRSEARHVIVVCSTIAPTTTTTIIIPTLEEFSGRRAGQDFDVALVPEFIRAPRALEDSRAPWMTVIAAPDEKVCARLVALLEPFGGEMRTTDDFITAELIKVTHNAYNANKIGFFNEMFRLASAVGVDGHFIAEVVSKSAEGSTNTEYGIRGGSPFGGACLPKDLDGLIAFAKTVGVPVPGLEAAREINESFEIETVGALDS
jgi:UDPglucose 6-dehydrogenase